MCARLHGSQHLARKRVLGAFALLFASVVSGLLVLLISPVHLLKSGPIIMVFFTCMNYSLDCMLSLLLNVYYQSIAMYTYRDCGGGNARSS